MEILTNVWSWYESKVDMLPQWGKIVLAIVLGYIGLILFFRTSKALFRFAIIAAAAVVIYYLLFL